ncbi:hypothetical protein BIW11_06832, partial [Tropilaelaps mercedesae]
MMLCIDQGTLSRMELLPLVNGNPLMEKPNGIPVGERTPLLEQQCPVDGIKRQKQQQQQLQQEISQTEGSVAYTEHTMSSLIRHRMEIQNCTDGLDLIQAEAYEIVDLMLTALSKVRQVPPQSSAQGKDPTESETVTPQMAITTSCMPPSAIRTQ